MKVWIVWLPNVWKSTLFNALTKNYWAEAANFPFCTIEPNSGMVNVNDVRLEKIRATINGQKVIPAVVDFTDIAGIVKWASSWEGLGNKFLANIRETDAILQVVRVFSDDNIIHVHGKVDPKYDIEIINSELILADVESLEKRIINNARKAKSDKELAGLQEVYEWIMKHLMEGKLACTYQMDEETKAKTKDLFLLTAKKFVYAANVSEDMMDTPERELKNILGITDAEIRVVPICAKLEEDMIEMTNEEKVDFLAEMGLISTGLDNLIKTCFDALGLQYYFTAWEKEVRAWTIKKGSTAPQAAGEIHTDFEKWFIKADVVNWKDLVEFWGWSGAKEHAKVRLEGKEYIVQDGDIMLFKFNV